MAEPTILHPSAEDLAARERVAFHHQRSALIAAALLGDVVAELLRFHMEGRVHDLPFSDIDPVAKTAEALLRIARIEAETEPFPPLEADYLSSLNQLAGATAKFLDDQCNPDPLLIAATIPESEVPC